MKRKPRVHSPSTMKSRAARKRHDLKQVEERLALLLQLLQHNIKQVLRHQRAR
jgi:hypothetical protein